MKSLRSGLPFSFLLAALALACPAGAAPAPGYPARPIRMIVSGGPGGGVDTISRLIGQKMTEDLGQPVVSENRPGAGTMLATELVAKAPPDGYTILLTTNSLSINAAVRKINLDPLADLAAITLVASAPDILVANPRLPAKNVQEVMALAREKPGKITFGSAGTGSGTHMDGELFKSLAGIDILHVPYKGGSQALADLLGGHIDLMFMNPIGVLGQVRRGDARALAVSTTSRLPLLPEVPTLAEAGVPGYDSGVWYAAFAPAGTPADIVDALHRAIVQALKSPAVEKELQSLGAQVVGSSPRDFHAYLAADIARWQKVVQGNPKLRIAD
ncbi:tripartite tricarboxylate transporter substrate binding protein [Pigmentiphaga soli]|uniref:Tripartite tricarboxylate transporter substrate binding protein n=1 Tax=Pigmentiphaga soli TaxID=1007095 RepID=A0ABP8HMT6_9BURK